MSVSPRFSLIIPAHNEESYLPRLLGTVDLARKEYWRGVDAIEVVVADNVSTDCTSEIARSRGCRVVSVDKRVIAAARNGGAKVARGEMLAFLDADSQMHPQTFNAIERAMVSGKFIGGATGVKLERMSIGIALTYMGMVPMVWVTGMDTGVVFCRREDFEIVGGYNEDRLFAEDVQFLWDLKRWGRERGQRLTRVTSVKAIASTRKFDRFGDWHYLTGLTRGLYFLLFARQAGLAFAKHYWYEDPR